MAKILTQNVDKKAAGSEVCLFTPVHWESCIQETLQILFFLPNCFVFSSFSITKKLLLQLYSGLGAFSLRKKNSVGIKWEKKNSKAWYVKVDDDDDEISNADNNNEEN